MNAYAVGKSLVHKLYAELLANGDGHHVDEREGRRLIRATAHLVADADGVPQLVWP